jgi:outer membrane protein OmpA-like peptidoglycan-associated protein
MEVLLLRMKWFIVFMATTALLFSLSLAAVATPNPIITGVAPAQGFDNQQIAITINGAKFYSPKTELKLVKAGQPDIIATDVVFSPNVITGTVNLQGQAVGSWDIVVTNIGKITKKRKPTILAGGFTILSAAPKITAITPASAVNNAPFTITVSGTNFRKGAVVGLKKDNQTLPFTNNEVTKEGRQINAQLNLSGVTPGLYDVEVKNTDGSTALFKQAFTVVAAPSVKPQPTASQPVKPTVKPTETAQPVDPNSLFKSIFFDFDKYMIRSDQATSLKTDLQILKQANDGYIILGGHADERGPNDYNIRLSAKRAEIIKRYLVQNGISAKRIITYAYGETSPKSLGHNEESWQFNRRVDIAIWAQVPSPKDALKK